VTWLVNVLNCRTPASGARLRTCGPPEVWPASRLRCRLSRCWQLTVQWRHRMTIRTAAVVRSSTSKMY
jgi:hypothetical protein